MEYVSIMSMVVVSCVCVCVCNEYGAAPFIPNAVVVDNRMPCIPVCILVQALHQLLCTQVLLALCSHYICVFLLSVLARYHSNSYLRCRGIVYSLLV